MAGGGAGEHESMDIQSGRIVSIISGAGETGKTHAEPRNWTLNSHHSQQLTVSGSKTET